MCCSLVCVYGLQVHDSTDACAGSFVDGQTNCGGRGRNILPKQSSPQTVVRHVVKFTTVCSKEGVRGKFYHMHVAPESLRRGKIYHFISRFGVRGKFYRT